MRPQPHKSGQLVVQHVLSVCFRRIERRREDGLREKRPFSHTANLTTIGQNNKLKTCLIRSREKCISDLIHLIG